ncbi:MAG: dihydroneopterin aldolase, partial [Chthoniobacterales bacterium]
MSNIADSIRIEELELTAHVGVPEEERSNPQRLTISITLWPSAGFGEMRDELAKTVDYSAVADEVQRFVDG